MKNNKLHLEAKAFDKIVEKRIKNGFNPDLKKKNIIKYFYNNPWRYPETRYFTFTKKISFILKYCKKNDLVLDVGCGLGTLSMELARSNINVTAIDISKKSIDYAKKFSKKSLTKKQYSRINYQQMPISQIINDPKKYKFNCIIFFKTLHHLENMPKLFKKIKNNLNKNGKIIIVEPFRDNFKYSNAIIAYLVRKLSNNWLNREKQINNSSLNKINQEINDIKKEYKYISDNKGYDQSPMDNSTSSKSLVLKELKKNFKIIKINEMEAFKDKILGGIRGKNYKKEIIFLNNFDDFLVKKKILKGVTSLIVAQK